MYNWEKSGNNGNVEKYLKLCKLQRDVGASLFGKNFVDSKGKNATLNVHFSEATHPLRRFKRSPAQWTRRTSAGVRETRNSLDVHLQISLQEPVHFPVVVIVVPAASHKSSLNPLTVSTATTKERLCTRTKADRIPNMQWM